MKLGHLSRRSKGAAGAAGGFRSVFREDGPESATQRCGAVGEDCFDFTSHQETVDQLSAGDSVTNVVPDPGPATLLLESVLMYPEAVGATQLLVHEQGRGFPPRDARAPAHGYPADSQSIVDEGSGCHVDGRRRFDAEVKEGGSDTLQIEGIREEREDFLPGPG